MRILLDENLPHRLRRMLSGHDVRTTAYQGWAGLTNGMLLKAADEAGFDAMITADQGIRYRQKQSQLSTRIDCSEYEQRNADRLQYGFHSSCARRGHGRRFGVCRLGQVVQSCVLHCPPVSRRRRRGRQESYSLGPERVFFPAIPPPSGFVP